MTETDIANRALSLLGAPAVSALDDGTANSRALGVQYEPVRDSLLRSHPWDFAIERAELSRETGGPLFGWGYSFVLPADCLRVIEFNTVDADRCASSFAVEGNRLVTNSTSARIAYVQRVTDPTQFDPLFADVFAHRLAASVAKSLTGSDTLAGNLEAAATKKLKQARFVNARQGRVPGPISGGVARGMRTVSDQERVSTVKGETGDDGLSAYELAVQNGFSGTVTEWLESLEGPQGIQGIQGEQGEQGEQGIQGIQGIQGEQGEQGDHGVSSEILRFEYIHGETSPAAGKFSTYSSGGRNYVVFAALDFNGIDSRLEITGFWGGLAKLVDMSSGERRTLSCEEGSRLDIGGNPPTVARRYRVWTTLEDYSSADNGKVYSVGLYNNAGEETNTRGITLYGSMFGGGSGEIYFMNFYNSDNFGISITPKTAPSGFKQITFPDKTGELIVITSPSSGDITYHNGTDWQRLAKGANGDVLTLQSGLPSWKEAIIDLASAEVTGTLPIANGGTGQTTAVSAFDALAPTTTKGDIIASNGTDNVRLAVGATNGHVLTVDSTEATGLKWAAGGGGAVLPAGLVSPYAGTTAPTGWLLCAGQTVSRATYADLFAAVSTTYGVGDGSTTFALPDLRGRAVSGKDDMGGSAAARLTNSGTGNPGIAGATLGASGGADRHQLTESEMPAHTHTQDYRATSANATAGSAVRPATGLTSAITGSTGGSAAHPNVQPTLVLNYIIKT